jgi:hypothetical protein
MGWTELMENRKEGLSGITSQLMQRQNQQEEDNSSAIGGVLGLLGGALTMLIPGGQVAGAGMMVGGATSLIRSR